MALNYFKFGIEVDKNIFNLRELINLLKKGQESVLPDTIQLLYLDIDKSLIIIIGRLKN